MPKQNQALRKVISDQKKDDTQNQYREIIPFQKLRLLYRIKDKRRRAIYVLYKCRFSAKKMTHLFRISESTIWREISIAFEIMSG